MKFTRRRPPVFTTCLFVIGWMAMFVGIDELPAQLNSVYVPFFSIFGALSVIVLMMMWLSYGARSRWMKRQQSIQDIKSMDWRQFEHFVAEAYRFEGWTVLEQQGAGKDGGIDLILKKKKKKVLVQCKHWKSKVGVKTVREMYGVMAHEKATGVKIVSLDGFTIDAQNFAQGKPIELVSADHLLGWKRSQQPTPDLPKDTICSKCGSVMIKRQNRHNKQHFWGCSSYPSCTHTRADLI